MRDAVVIRNRLAARDWVLAAAIGLLSAGVILATSAPGLDPSMWEEVSVVAGIRPPRAIFPGLWRALVSWMFPLFGISGALRVLSVAGAAVGGLCAALTYLTVRQSLAFLVRLDDSHEVWLRFIAPFFAAVAAIFLGVSEPFLRIAQIFTPEELRFLMLLLALFGWLRWLTVGGNGKVYLLTALCGVFAAETPFAFVLPPLFLLAYFKLWRGVVDGLFAASQDLPNPDQLPRWRMFFLFLASLGAAVYLNVAVFAAYGGISANGWNFGDIYFRYGAGYWKALADASTMAGWALGLGFGLFPLIVAVRLFPSVTRDDRPMPFHLGVVMVFAAALAAMQCGAFPSARFWVFMKDAVLVPSGFLLSFYVLGTAATLALAGSSFALECQRFYLPEGQARPGVALRMVAPAVAVLLLALASLRLPKPLEAEMHGIVFDALRETVRECGGAKWIFTDGRLDAGLELVASSMGAPVRTLNMMSGAGNWERTIRTRGFEAGPDRDNAEIGVPALLRVWASEKPGGMDEAALQLGFEFWRRERKPLPKASGLVAREKGLSDEEAARGIEAAKALSERILAVSSKLGGETPSPALASAFSAVSWRLSRFARLRNDEQLADRLDSSNTALKRLLSMIEYERQRTFMQLTPREGLQLALKRADFVEARRFAAAVLRSDEDDTEANFGMGMSYLKENLTKDAEFYLRRCLKRRPDEPAVLNNLSIICRKARRYDEAVELAQHALRMLPDSPEVKRTLEDARNKAP